MEEITTYAIVVLLIVKYRKSSRLENLYCCPPFSLQVNPHKYAGSIPLFLKYGYYDRKFNAIFCIIPIILVDYSHCKGGASKKSDLKGRVT